MTDFEPHDFWDFSLSVYRRPKVATTCIDLQGRFGVDVNLILFCCWWGGSVGTMSEFHFTSVADRADEWHRAVVIPLRTARLRTRSGAPNLKSLESETLYRRLLGAELEAEHAEQLMIARTAEEISLPSASDPSFRSMVENLRLYFDRLHVQIDNATARSLAVIILACCDEGPPQDEVLQELLAR